MHTLSRDTLKGLLTPQPGPCLSLYQATHRSHPDNAQDPIAYRNLVRQLEEALGADVSGTERVELLAPLHALAEDTAFWRHTLDGLAVLRAPGFLQIFRLPRPVPNLALVSDTWHVKPLLRHGQTADRFQVLCLTRSDVRLYEGNRNGLQQVDLAPDVPVTIQDALGDQFTDPYLKVSTYGMGPAGAPGSAMRHGHGDKSDESTVDTQRFFRVVDRAIFEHHSNPGRLPLVLVALPEYQGVFRGLSNNRFLLPQGIDTDPGSLDIEALRARAWAIVEPGYHRETREIIDLFRARHGTGLASDDLQKTFEAALAGRVQTLLVDADRHIPGRIDGAAQSVELADSFSVSGVVDVLDDIAETVLRNGGEALVVPSEIMPSKTGLAALFRF